MKITILYNLPKTDLEADLDTQESALAVAEELKAAGLGIQLLGITIEEYSNFLAKVKGDFVFNLIEWDGEDWPFGVKAIEVLEKSGIPFSGSGSVGYRISSDKTEMKRVMKEKNIPTPAWSVWDGLEWSRSLEQLKFPVIIKLAWGHCAAGITQDSLAENVNEASLKARRLNETYHQSILAEEYIKGRELHITVLEKNGQPWVLPPAEVSFKSKPGYLPILTYDMKWNDKSLEFAMAGDMLIPKLPGRLQKKIETLAMKAYRVLGGRDYPRLDLRLDGASLWVLEINNNPGIDFEMDSGIGASSAAAGFTFRTLLLHIVRNALLRFKPVSYDPISL